ncbi:amidohydrolase [Paenibacillus glucanolyticus]|jgi:L-fuconolactonase|nr:amidohydrolase [Paenibacillus glucanolyticus]AVV57209.1 amidohydrolase [Paenibacillus glucanolyticus]MPY16687.1 amidohydrolase family protein [Paenibacillus glucanolyticus]
MFMRVDAHQHYWLIERGDYGWIKPDIPELYRNFLPSDLKPHLDLHRFDGSITVQAAPTMEETDYLLSLADHDSSILGVVGWIDLFDPEHRQHYERFRKHPKFIGFRIMIQDMPDAQVILEPSYIEAFSGYAKEEVPIDLLVLSHQLEPLLKLIQQVPSIRGVVDHLGKPPIRSGRIEPWESLLKQIAGFPSIYCKLSGMVTEAEHRRWSQEDFNKYVHKVTAMFGPERVMFGSDWPVCLLSAEYGQVVDVLAEALPKSWGEAEYARLFGLNAKAFYKLKDVRGDGLEE